MLCQPKHDPLIRLVVFLKVCVDEEARENVVVHRHDRATACLENTTNEEEFEPVPKSREGEEKGNDG